LEKLGRRIAMLGGLLACYFCGCIWFYCYSGGGLVFILLRCVIPYVFFDLAKLWLADRLANRLKKVIKLPSRA
jgi:biotin transport system substrate-specific component